MIANILNRTVNFQRTVQINALPTPLTVPYRKNDPMSPGDLAEFISPDTMSHQLGIVKSRIAIGQSSPMASQSYNIFSREQGSNIVRPYYVRFHRPNFIENVDGREESLVHFGRYLDEFEDKAIWEYNKKSSTFQSHLNQIKKSLGMGADRLIYLNEFTSKIFSTSTPTDYQTYAAHFYLTRHDEICRDIFNLQASTYYLQPEDVRRVIRKTLEMSSKNPNQIRALNAKISAGRVCQLSEDDRELLNFCLFYASGNNLDNQKQSQYLRIVQSILGFVRNEYDVFQKLLSLSCFILTTSPIMFQSGALQNENETFCKVEANNKNPQNSLAIKNPTEEFERVEFHNPVYTIDDPETIEVDDAISIEGNTLHVHIADPCAIIKPDSLVEKIARSRVSNVYLPEKVFSMIPYQVARQVSLDSGVSRLALTFSFQLDQQGDITNYKTTPSILHCIKRLDYQEADEMLEGGEFKDMMKLVKQHLKYRQNQGLIALDIPRMKIKVKAGTISVQREDQNTNSRLLVSELMVMSGRVAANVLFSNSIPAPYRYHNDPKVQVPKMKSIKDMLSLLEKLSPAAVDIFPRRHWAMGLDCYVKATSPIRRYMDMITHRQLYSLINGSKECAYSTEHLQDILPKAYRHEMYIKGLQKSANRFWMNVYLSKLLQKGPVELKGTVMGVEKASGTVSVFLGDPVLLLYQAKVFAWNGGNGVYFLNVGEDYKFRLTEINILRGFMTLQVIQSKQY